MPGQYCGGGGVVVDAGTAVGIAVGVVVGASAEVGIAVDVGVGAGVAANENSVVALMVWASVSVLDSK